MRISNLEGEGNVGLQGLTAYGAYVLGNVELVGGVLCISRKRLDLYLLRVAVIVDRSLELVAAEIGHIKIIIVYRGRIEGRGKFDAPNELACFKFQLLFYLAFNLLRCGFDIDKVHKLPPSESCSYFSLYRYIVILAHFIYVEKIK